MVSVWTNDDMKMSVLATRNSGTGDLGGEQHVASDSHRLVAIGLPFHFGVTFILSSFESYELNIHCVQVWSVVRI